MHMIPRTRTSTHTHTHTHTHTTAATSRAVGSAEKRGHVIRKSGALPIPQFYSFSSSCKQLEKLRIITHVIRKSGALPIPIILHRFYSFSSFLQLPYLSSRT